MKKMVAMLIASALLCCLSVQIAATDKLTVTGHGVISVPADTVTISFSVDVKSASAADSAKKSETVGEKLASAVNKYGTVYEESFFSYEDSENGKWCFSRSYVLSSNYPSKADEICSLLTSSGATAIYFIGFSLNETKAHQEKALDAALKDARARASALGNTLGEREIIDYGDCMCICSENPDKRGYVTIECTVKIIYY